MSRVTAITEDGHDHGDLDQGLTSTGLLGDSAKIAVAVAASRATGLLRIVMVAAILGPTVLGDLFVAINVLPLILYDIIAGSAISSVLVPPLVRLLALEPIERVRRFVGNASGIIVAGTSTVVAAALLLREPIAAIITAGVDRTLADDAARTAVVLLVVIVPQLVLYALIGVFVSVQHSRRRFLLPSAAPIVENVVLMATVLAVGSIHGTGMEVSDVSTEVLVLLGLGSSLAVGVHAVVQAVGALRAIGPFRLSLGRSDPAVRSLAGPARDSFGWSSVVAGRQFALIVAASYAGAGAVQAFEIATLVYFIPVALIGRPVASAALPRLVAAGHSNDVTAGYLHAVRLAAWLAVPAGLALVVLASPLAEGIASGKFDNDNPVQLLVYALAGLGLGAASEALFEVARQTMMANPGDRVALRRSTWIRAGVAAVGIPAAVMLLEGPPIIAALGVVVSLGDGAALVVVHRSLRRTPGWPSPDLAGPSHWPRILFASTIAIGLGAIVDEVVVARWSGSIEDPTRLAATTATAVASYLVIAWLATRRFAMLSGTGDRPGEAPTPGTGSGATRPGVCA
ncbi:MAG: lipid II flippase MurJ [Acidimicrobiales bacterium]